MYLLHIVHIFSKFLPPANEVCEGYVFTGVCLSMGGHVWWGACVGGMHGGGEVCMAGGCAWWGACVVGGMHGGGVHGRGGMCSWGHAWQGVVHGRGVCMAGGMCGRGACMVVVGGMHGRGHVLWGG